MLAVAGLAIVGASLGLDRVVQFDPQGWLLWGREVTSPALHFSTQSYPSWKPLPFLFAVPLSLTGGAAPALWLAIERAGALAGAVLAYSLAREAAGRLAGVLAAGGVVLAPAWITLSIDGRSEPLVIALLLGSLAAHRAGHRRVALMLLVFAALDRPEAIALACIYALLYGERRARYWGFAAALIAIVPALWLGGDWLGSGDPLHGAKLAHSAAGGGHPPGAPLLVLMRAWVREVSAPLLAGAGAGVAIAAIRRDRQQLKLAAMVLAWLSADAALLATGYPQSQMPRFVLPAAALACVFGAVGLARLAGAAPYRRVRIAAGLAALALVLPFALQGVESAAAGVRAAVWYARSITSMDDAVADTGGARVLVRCGHLAVNHWAETQLAWGLDVEPNRVGRPRAPGIVLADRRARWSVLYVGRPMRGCALAHAATVTRQFSSRRQG